MKVANPIVRENALIQLALVFPLVRAEQPQREIDEIISLGFQRLMESLEDTQPSYTQLKVQQFPIPSLTEIFFCLFSVRRQGVISIGRVLSLYWEVFPFHTLQRIIEQLVTQTVFDKSSVHVREVRTLSFTYSTTLNKSLL